MFNFVRYKKKMNFHNFFKNYTLQQNWLQKHNTVQVLLVALQSSDTARLYFAEIELQLGQHLGYT